MKIFLLILYFISATCFVVNLYLISTLNLSWVQILGASILDGMMLIGNIMTLWAYIYDED